jgi:phage gp37-like protein
MFRDIESAIVDRLKSKMPAGVQVVTFADLARVPDYRNKSPAVFVVYDGFAPVATPGPTIPQVQSIDVKFVIVVTTKNAAGNGIGTAARDESAVLEQTAVEALIGLHVGGGKYLRLSGGQAAEYDAGYSYTPIGIACQRTIKALKD